jgi:hypothetical protein
VVVSEHFLQADQIDFTGVDLGRDRGEPLGDAGALQWKPAYVQAGDVQAHGHGVTHRNHREGLH